MKEIWVRLEDYPDYEVSNLGRIVSHKIHRGQPGPRLLSPGRGTKGYLTVRIWNEAGVRTWKLHALVALAFHGPKPEGLEVRHLDGDNQNNRAGNLAYGTSDENWEDRVRHRTHCGNDHALAGNSYPKAGSKRGRVCRTCQRDAEARRAPRRRSA